ncbi:MAG: hypothetical protein ACKN8Y_09990, partial [Polynucleobacter victoriensis]
MSENKSPKPAETPRLRTRFEDAQIAIEGGAEPANYLHRIKSFILRTGRLTAGQARAIETLGPQFLLPYTGEGIDWQKSFHQDGNNQAAALVNRPKILEIGFGMGETTAKIATARSDDD